MRTAVWIHVVWMIAAVAVGTWSGYLGLVRATMKGGRCFLPGCYTLSAHKWTGIVFHTMLYSGLAYAWAMVEFIIGVEAGGLWAWHRWLGWTVGAIYLPAMVAGIHLLYRPAVGGRALPVAHMITNFTACSLIAVQIVLAAYAFGWLD